MFDERRHEPVNDWKLILIEANEWDGMEGDILRFDGFYWLSTWSSQISSLAPSSFVVVEWKAESIIN